MVAFHLLVVPFYAESGFPSVDCSNVVFSVSSWDDVSGGCRQMNGPILLQQSIVIM